MPLEAFLQCRSLDGYQVVPVRSETQNALYRVFVNPWRESKDNICECKGYMFTGHCKHQLIASEQICGWSEYEDDSRRGKMDPYEECPWCYGPTHYVWEWVNGPKRSNR